MGRPKGSKNKPKSTFDPIARIGDPPVSSGIVDCGTCGKTYAGPPSDCPHDSKRKRGRPRKTPLIVDTVKAAQDADKASRDYIDSAGLKLDEAYFSIPKAERPPYSRYIESSVLGAIYRKRVKGSRKAQETR
jgi:hypothetical protein